MIIYKVGENEFDLKLSRNEIVAVSNCINEVRNAIILPEFQTRIGLDEESVRTLHRQILAALDALG
jgi:hypothetical protein